MEKDQSHIFERWQQEQKIIEAERAKAPELFKREPQIDDDEILFRLGIHLPGEEENIRPRGFIKLNPLDFIVEEIGREGRVSTVDYENQNPLASASPTGGKTIFCDLVKVGISSIEAVKQLAKILGIEEKNIGTAGIKDAVALTSQRISMTGLEGRTLDIVKPTNFFLKNLETGKGAISTGDLKGNRFTILVRTENSLKSDWLKAHLGGLKEGFWNFYWLQRFGDRLLSHWWGLLLLRGDYQGLITSYLSDSGPRDLPYFKNLREQAGKMPGQWEKIENLFSKFEYGFRYELTLVKHLKAKPTDFVGALNLIPEQVRLWAYAYASYLFNRKLSQLAAASSGPSDLPLILSPNTKDRALYQDYFGADKVPARFDNNLRPFPFIRLLPRKVETRLKAEIKGSKTVADGVIIAFDLAKGAYATTFLSHLFTLVSGQPVPAWVKGTDYDTKEELGTGSLKEVKEIFKNYIVKALSEEPNKD